MHSNPSATQSLPAWDRPTGTAIPIVELAIFDIGSACFGLPISTIDRVIDLSAGNHDFSSLLIDAEIIDLHHRLFGLSLADPHIWIMFNSLKGRLYRIPADTLPTLIPVPLDRIRILPDDVRSANPLGIASHVALVTTESQGKLTVLTIVL
jgi:hypothetical protein